MKDIEDAVAKLDIDKVVQEAKNMGIDVIENSPYNTHTINIDGVRVPLDVQRHLSTNKSSTDKILDKLYDAINLLDIIEDSVEPTTYLDIYYDAMELLYEFSEELESII